MPTTATRRLTISIYPDCDTENPCDNDVFTVHSFSRRHAAFTHPDTLGMDSIGFRRKLECGTAFILDYHEHGNCVWSLSGTGPQCQWDTARCAGVLVLNDPQAIRRENRHEQARRFLETYTDWCNGECYWFSIDDEDGNPVDSCGGFIGSDDVWAGLCESLQPGDKVQFAGMAKDIADYKRLPKGVELWEESDDEEDDE